MESKRGGGGRMNKKEKLSELRDKIAKERIEIMKLNSIVKLKDGKKGKVIGQLANGEYLLASGKGGQITYFKAEDIIS